MAGEKKTADTTITKEETATNRKEIRYIFRSFTRFPAPYWKPITGLNSNGKSQIKSIKQKLSVQQNGDGSNSVFTGQRHHNDVKKKCNDSIGELGYHFGRTIIAGIQHLLYRKRKTAEPEISPGKQKKT